MSGSTLYQYLTGSFASFAMLCLFTGHSAAKSLQVPENHPLTGAWDVYHSAAVAYCDGKQLPISAEGPDRVTIEPQGDGRITVDGVEGQLVMRRVTAQRFETTELNGMKALQRVDPGEWALLAEAMGDQGLLYTAKKSAGGATLAFLLGWMKSEPGTLRGHISMPGGPCQVVRSFHAER